VRYLAFNVINFVVKIEEFVIIETLNPILYAVSIIKFKFFDKVGSPPAIFNLIS